VLARHALGLVNTEYLAAPGTGPPFFFVPDEMPHAELPDTLQVINHTHAVFRPVTLIQMVQPGAREAVTVETVFDLAIDYLLAVLDTARNAGS